MNNHAFCSKRKYKLFLRDCNQSLRLFMQYAYYTHTPFFIVKFLQFFMFLFTLFLTKRDWTSSQKNPIFFYSFKFYYSALERLCNQVYFETKFLLLKLYYVVFQMRSLLNVAYLSYLIVIFVKTSLKVSCFMSSIHCIVFLPLDYLFLISISSSHYDFVPLGKLRFFDLTNSCY